MDSSVMALALLTLSTIAKDSLKSKFEKFWKFKTIHGNSFSLIFTPMTTRANESE